MGRVFPEFRVNVYVNHRSNPVAPYEQLIKDYSDPDEMGPHCSTSEPVDELLTESELEAFSAFMSAQYCWKVEAIEIQVPVNRKNLGYCLGQIPTGRFDGHVLYDRKTPGYSLRFDVGGYFELGEHSYPVVVDTHNMPTEPSSSPDADIPF